MKMEPINWNEDLPPASCEEEYRSLVRALQRTKGFGLLFVRCADAEEERLIARVKAETPKKRIEVLTLTKSIDDIYSQIEALPNREQINVLFVRGLKYSLYEYEDTKRTLGWGSEETYVYSWKGVPRILTNLNQQRERLRDNFNICFVFLIPLFALRYIIHRAPDFFDWRSGLFDIPSQSELLEQEAKRIFLEGGDFEEYWNMSSEQRLRKFLDIKELLEERNQAPERRGELLYELGNLLAVEGEWEASIANYDEAIRLKQSFYKAWSNRGYALGILQRYKDAVASYDEALKIKPNHHRSWHYRGYALEELGYYEEAVISYDKGQELKPSCSEGWFGYGRALHHLGRYEEAVNSFDKSLEIKPDNYSTWNWRGYALYYLGRYEEAVNSFDKSLEIKPDENYDAWAMRSNASCKANFDK